MCEFQSSTQSSAWTFSPDVLSKVRAHTNQLTIAYLSTTDKAEARRHVDQFPRSHACDMARDPTTGDTLPSATPPIANIASYLTVEDEIALQKYYEQLIIKTCGRDSEQERLQRSEKVAGTAVAYFKRFYLSNSLMEHDPKVLMPLCVFLASKIEEEVVSITELEKATGVGMNVMLLKELTLLTAMRFQLRAFHPHKPLLALMDDVQQHLQRQGAPPPPKDLSQALQSWHHRATRLVEQSLLTDLSLLHTPAAIALGVLLQTMDRTMFPGFDELAFLQGRFGGQPGFEALQQDLASIREVLRTEANKAVDPKELKPINSKLKKCAVWANTEGPRKKKLKTEA